MGPEAVRCALPERLASDDVLRIELQLCIRVAADRP